MKHCEKNGGERDFQKTNSSASYFNKQEKYRQKTFGTFKEYH